MPDLNETEWSPGEISTLALLKQHCFVWNVFAFVLGNENVTQCPVLKYINTVLPIYIKRSIAYVFCSYFLFFFFSEIFNQFWNLPTLSLVQLSGGGRCHLCATAWNPVRKFAADLKWNPDLFCDYSLSLPLRSVRLHKPVATQMNVTPAHGFSQWSPPLAPEPSLHFALLPSDYDLKRSADMTHSHNALWLNPEP